MILIPYMYKTQENYHVGFISTHLLLLGRDDIVSLKQLELNENIKLSSKLTPSHVRRLFITLIPEK